MRSRLLALAAALAATLAGAAVPGVAARAATPLSVHTVGNHLVNGSGHPIRLIGVNYSGTEYACIQGWGIFDGPHNLAAVQAMKTWKVNAVRLPLNEDCWLGINHVGSTYGGAAYRNAVTSFVKLLTSHGIYAIVELHWSAPGTTKADGQRPMPDASHSPPFWRSVASTFKSNRAVIFDLFNEPYPDNNTDSLAAWRCWKFGGSCAGVDYEVAGMRQLMQVVRKTGAKNVVMLGGVTYANSLTQWLRYRPYDAAGETVAAAHVYGNNGCGAQNNAACLTTQVAPVAKRFPVVFGETGETFDDSECGHSNTRTIYDWADSHHVSYLAWTWDTWGSCLSLISRFDGTVNRTDPSGQTYASYVHQHFLNRPS